MAQISQEALLRKPEVLKLTGLSNSSLYNYIKSGVLKPGVPIGPRLKGWEGCRSWANDPKGFTPLIGAKANMVIGKKFIPAGNETVDNVVELSLANFSLTSQSSTVKTTKAGNNFCPATETTIFACSTDTKMISLCASRDLSANTGQLTYRLTPTGGSAEITYPDALQHPKNAFKQGQLQLMGDKTVSFLSFDKGSFRYVIYAANGKNLYKNGVAVEQGGKRIASLKCQGDAEDNLDALSNAGITQDVRGFSLP